MIAPCPAFRRGVAYAAMRTVNQWLDEYGASHRNPANKLLHWICVPIIVVSMVGLLWYLPVPQALRAVSPLLNWGTVLLVGAVVYYVAISWSLALGMVLFAGAVLGCLVWLQTLPWPLWTLCLGLFVVAACETVNPYTNETQTSKDAKGAGIGAAAGAVVGLLTKGDKLQNALIGAGVGALAGGGVGYYMDCLLYTSDAADERS